MDIDMAKFLNRGEYAIVAHPQQEYEDHIRVADFGCG